MCFFLTDGSRQLICTNPWAPVEETIGPHRVDDKEIKNPRIKLEDYDKRNHNILMISIIRMLCDDNIYIYIYICICVYVYTCVYVCVYVYIYIYMYRCICMYVRVCIYVCVYVCMYIYIYIYIYIYSFTYIYEMYA